MKQKLEVEQAKANALKTLRSAIRLRHSLAADTELNERLPQAERFFDMAVLNGELPDPLSILEALNA